MATPSIAAEAQSISHESVSEWLRTRPGERCLIRVSAADTDGAYSVVEIVSDPDDGTPIHVHQNEDEHFLILEGSARIVYGDKTFDASAGTSITLNRGIPHAWGNRSDCPLRMVVIVSPGGWEEALRLTRRGRAAGERRFYAVLGRPGLAAGGAGEGADRPLDRGSNPAIRATLSDRGSASSLN
jgi:mannose-6-phosphate isomerase-like protein (cupin superfamily)